MSSLQIMDKTYKADNCVREDRVSGILPVKLLSARKLTKVKTIICLASVAIRIRLKHQAIKSNQSL